MDKMDELLIHEYTKGFIGFFFAKWYISLCCNSTMHLSQPDVEVLCETFRKELKWQQSWLINVLSELWNCYSLEWYIRYCHRYLEPTLAYLITPFIVSYLSFPSSRSDNNNLILFPTAFNSLTLPTPVCSPFFPTPYS